MKDRLIAGALRFAVWCISLLPLSAARGFGRAIGWLVYRFGSSTVATTRDNIRRCFPELDTTTLNQLVRRSIAHTAMLAMESGVLWYWPDERWRTLVQERSGFEHITQAQAAGRGVLVLVPHFGNWELFALLLGPYGYTCLYDPPRLASLEAPIVQARQRTGGTLLPIGRRGVRALTRTLEAGGISVLLPDQVPDPRSGVEAPFFGHEALTMTLVQKLARRTGPLVVMASIRRVPAGFSVAVQVLDDAVADADERLAATALNAAVEEVVRLDPAQYQWEYKRFKRPRAGKPPRI